MRAYLGPTELLCKARCDAEQKGLRGQTSEYRTSAQYRDEGHEYAMGNENLSEVIVLKLWQGYSYTFCTCILMSGMTTRNQNVNYMQYCFKRTT
jgi:hypothetical protein